MTRIRSANVEDLVEVLADQQHGDAVRGRLAQVSVDGLDRADVEPARRRGDDEGLRLARELPREDDLLQIAAGEEPRRGRRPGTPDVVALGSARPHGRESCAGSRNGPRVTSPPRYALRTTFDAMLRLGATPVESRSSGTCATPARIAARGSPSRSGRPPTLTSPALAGRIPGEHLGELALSVPGDARHPENLAGPHGEVTSCNASTPRSPRARSPSASRTTSPISPASRRRSTSTSRPTIRDASPRA